ncbi:MAG: carboxypeptidase regulatory-like domain-containing protein [Phycisphaerales bacterium]|nr:carboxypeptidase regulatory-like domain-containing protein [Phycisphaerales bacterium]
MISGIVTNGNGAPVLNVTVTLRGWGPCTHYYADASVRTGADGSFGFDGVGPDPEKTRWRVSLSDDDWVATPVFAVPGQNDVRIVAHRGAVIRGSIVYPDGTPAANALVRSDAWPDEVRADGRGRFEARAVPPGTQRITATARSPEGMDVGWRGSVDVDVIDGSSTDGIRLVVGADPGRSFISVEVFEADGTPYPAADVKLWCECVEVDADPVPGGALCVHVPPGTLLTMTATVTTETMTSCARSDTPVPTSESPRAEPYVLRLGPIGVLRLRLEDAAGDPVALSRATVVADRQPSLDGDVPLAADETFTATIRVPGFAARSVRFEPPQPRAREETVRLRPASGLRGRIVGANGGAVPGTAGVSARVVGDSDGVETLSASIDAGGRFLLDEAPAGRATLLVSLDGRPAVRREYDLPAGDILDVGEIVMPALVTTRFIVVSGEGRPLGGAVVSFLDPGGAPFGPLTTSRSDGTFEVVAATAAPMQVLVSRAGYGTRVVDRSCDADQQQRISLGVAGRVHVLAPAVTDAGPRRVEVIIPGAPLVRWTPAEVGSSGSGGLRTPEGVVFDGFPAGPVEIRLVTSQRRLSRLVDVVAGATVECRFGP